MFVTVVLALLHLLVVTRDARSSDADLQLWFPVQVIHPVGDQWSLSVQAEPRFDDNISRVSQVVYKPAINFHFNSTWAFSAGYKYIDKYQEADERDIWQELHLNRKLDDLVTGFQLRLEERFIGGIDGVLPRLRLLEHISHPIGDSQSYLTGFGAIRLNLGDLDEGPVSGFEQSRIYAALGRHIGDRIQFEAGYLWRYERERTGDDKSDHAIHFQLLYNTRSKPVRKPSARDRYR
jgi:hypothetical protein